MMNQINRNPASVIPLRSYLTASANLDTDIETRRRRLREHHQAREDEIVAENRSLLEAAEQCLDHELDQRQRALNMDLEASFGPQEQRPHDTGGQLLPPDMRFDYDPQNILLTDVNTSQNHSDADLFLGIPDEHDLLAAFGDVQPIDASSRTDPEGTYSDLAGAAAIPQSTFSLPDSTYGGSYLTCLCGKATLGEQGLCMSCHRRLDNNAHFS